MSGSGPISKALALAESAHAGQTDKAGEPYYGHIQRVYLRTMDHLSALPKGLLSADDERDIACAAILHDLIEDTDYTLDDLRAMGYGPGVVDRVARLTGFPASLTYQQNIEAMASEGDIGVIIVKLADNEDNTDPHRASQVPELRPRYERSKRTLRAALAALSHRPPQEPDQENRGGSHGASSIV